MAATLLIGRFLGFIREIQIAATFGISQNSDFAVLLLTTPDLFVNLLLAGGLSAALIPEFRRLDEAGKAILFARCLVAIGAFFFLIFIIIVIFPSILIYLFAPYYVDKLDLVPHSHIIVMSIAIPISGLTGITTALLNSDGRFVIAASGTLIFNCTLILALYFFSDYSDILMLLSMAIVVGAVLRFSSQAFFLKAYLPQGKFGIFPDSNSFALARRFVQALSATTIVLVVPLIIRSVLSVYGDGFIAAFNFATKLIELPIAIAIASMATVFFTRISGQIANGDIKGAQESFSQNSILAFLVGCSICLPAIMFSAPITETVFGYGKMSSSNIELIADLATIGFLSLPFVGISSLATAVLNAQKRTEILFMRTLRCSVVLPLALIPGIVTKNAGIAFLALPAFHVFLAIYLAHAAELRILRKHARLVVFGLISVVTIATGAAMSQIFLGGISAWIQSSVALVFISIGITTSGLLVYLFRKGKE